MKYIDGLKHFFDYETELPAGSGFSLFGPCHLLWLAGIIAGSRLMAFKYADNKSVIRRIFGVLFPVVAVYRDAVLIVTGHFDRYYLPFHLCEMALWIGCFYCVTQWRAAGVVYVLLCVPGAAAALLFPDWVMYPFFHYMHIHDFLSHGMIVAFGMCLTTSGEVVPAWREILYPAGFCAAGMSILYPLNAWLGTNFWFLNAPSPGCAPLEWIWQTAGSRWYLAGYSIFVMAVVCVWLCVLDLQGKRRCAILKNSG